MRTFTFRDLLEEATSVVDLARLLGAACMEREAEVKVELEDELLAAVVEKLRDHVIASEPRQWPAVVAAPAELEARLGEPFANHLDQADLHYPLDCLGVLRGLCRRVLPGIYRDTAGEVPLRRGTPVPFALRPLLGAVEKTPHPETLNKSGLLAGYGHRLFEFWPEKESLRVTLDFGVREEVDELTWSDRERLPRIATVHPADCGALRIGTRTKTRFFDARPTMWQPEEVVSLLERVADVEIAVLPELSLPEPGALVEALAVAPERVPRLIVAGSAHLRAKEDGREVRANEARIYLDGRPIGRHRKYVPYEAGRLAGKKLPQPLKEWLTDEPKTITVLSGRHSHLAVVICADLNDSGVPQKLLAAGVNTLIVPSFTPKKGAFHGPIGDLAARCQAICVIANAPPEEGARPFHGMVAVPRPDPDQAVTTYPRPQGPAPTQIAVFDPNEPLETAVSWR